MSQMQANSGLFESDKEQVQAVEEILVDALGGGLGNLSSKGEIVESKQTVPNTHFGKAVKTRDWGDKFQSLNKVFGQAQNDRQELNEMRNKHIDLFKQMQDNGDEDYRSLTKIITQDTIAYINKRVQAIIQKLGPTPTRYSLFSLGSMPREESGFYTDLEIGILLEKNTPEAQKYFQKLIQLLSDQLFLLGEHPDVGGKGLRIDEADNAPFHMRWHFRHASPDNAREIFTDNLAKREIGKKLQVPYEGSRIFLTTPERFASYSDPDFDKNEKKKNSYLSRKKRSAYERYLTNKMYRKALTSDQYKGLSRKEIYQDVQRYVKDAVRPYSARERNLVKSTRTLVRNIMHLNGDESLFNRYLDKRERSLSKRVQSKSPLVKTERQNVAISKLTDDILKHIADDKSPIATGKLGDTIDLKRRFYRLPEQVLTDLGFYFDLGPKLQNTQDIAMELVNRGFFSEEVGHAFKDWMSYATYLRLKEQANVRKQGFAIPTSTEEYQDQLGDLEKEMAALKRKQEAAALVHAPSSMLDEIEEQINNVVKDIKRLKKQEPLLPHSVISPEEKSRMEDFLQTCHGLFERTKDFLSGNWRAFQ